MRPPVAMPLAEMMIAVPAHSVDRDRVLTERVSWRSGGGGAGQVPGDHGLGGAGSRSSGCAQ